jgi:uncharacterized membrane protein YphA (DoxX/SURF4 family)
MRIALWTVQIVLAAMFVFGGVVKLTMPLDELVAQVGVPGLLLQFISVMEVLGGLGLVLPGLLRIRQELTPLAAAGLSIIMAGAVVLGIRLGDPLATLMPLVVGLLTLFVAYGRWRLAPQGPAAAAVRPAAAR